MSEKVFRNFTLLYEIRFKLTIHFNKTNLNPVLTKLCEVRHPKSTVIDKKDNSKLQKDYQRVIIEVAHDVIIVVHPAPEVTLGKGICWM